MTVESVEALPPATAPKASPQERAGQVAAVLTLMEEGKSEAEACRDVNIARSTFRQAAVRFGSDAYARACEAIALEQVQRLEEVIVMVQLGKLAPDVGRVVLDGRKWIASRLFRPIWGDRTATEITGPGGGPVEIQNLTVEEIDARLAALTTRFNGG